MTTGVVHIGGKFTAGVTTFNVNLRKNVNIADSVKMPAVNLPSMSSTLSVHLESLINSRIFQKI
jgi:hypothetical protein